MAPDRSQRLPTAPYDYKHTLLLFSSSMTPDDFQRLPSRELTPQPHSQIKTWISSNDIKDKRALMDARKLIETKVSVAARESLFNFHTISLFSYLITHGKLIETKVSA